MAKPERLQRLEPTAPAELVTICTKAMAPSRSDRYPIAKELAEDLQRYQRGLLVGAHEYSTFALIMRWIRNHKTEVAIASIALVLLVALGSVSFLNIVKERDATRDALQQTQVAKATAEKERDTARVRLADALVEKAKRSEEDGKKIEAGILYATALSAREDPIARARKLVKVRDREVKAVGRRTLDEDPTLIAGYGSRSSKVGRNAPCPCGSGKKYKKCCGR